MPGGGNRKGKKMSHLRMEGKTTQLSALSITIRHRFPLFLFLRILHNFIVQWKNLQNNFFFFVFAR